MKLKDLLTYAVAGSPSGDLETLNALREFYETWYNLMDSPLEEVKT